ncbi:MAG TPA: YHS domain-containing protein [Candidatus Krumholzibacterium sp.]|nr:YHS domain-containing protein [Candidatus Krumholzibacterium sp.]
MKRFMFLLLAVALVSSVGCGQNSEEQSTDFQQEAKKVTGGSLIDPVDGKPVDITVSKYSYIYDSREYNFNSKENMEAFIKDPAKYLKDK